MRPYRDAPLLQVIGGRPLHPSWKVTLVTAPWQPPADITHAVGVPSSYRRHAVSYRVGDPGLPLALCTGVHLAGAPLPHLHLLDCARCCDTLDRHDLLALD